MKQRNSTNHLGHWILWLHQSSLAHPNILIALGIELYMGRKYFFGMYCSNNHNNVHYVLVFVIYVQHSTCHGLEVAIGSLSL
jgi:hypothetical protein